MTPTEHTDYRFAIIPEWILMQDLPHLHVALYAQLALFADARTATCWPSVTTLGERVGRTKITVRNALKEMQAAGMITIQPRRGTSNLYTIHRLPPEGGVSRFTPPGKPIDRGGVSGLTGGGLVGLPQTRTNEPDSLNQTDVTPRKRNEHWDAIVDLLGDPPPGQQSLMGRLVAKASALPPAEIRRRANIYARAFSGKPLTLAAFDKHWDWLGSPAGELAATPNVKSKINRPQYQQQGGPNDSKTH